VSPAVDEESWCAIHAAFQAPHEVTPDLGPERATLQRLAQSFLG
jgi:hypothetical protein